METNRTNKTLLKKGFQFLAFALLCLFMGPILLSIAFDNPEKPLYIPILIMGCLVSAIAISLVFNGIRTIIKSLFNN